MCFSARPLDSVPGRDERIVELVSARESSPAGFSSRSHTILVVVAESASVCNLLAELSPCIPPKATVALALHGSLRAAATAKQRPKQPKQQMRPQQPDDGRRRELRELQAPTDDERQPAARALVRAVWIELVSSTAQRTTIIFSRSFAPPARELTRAGAVTLSRRSLEACGKRKTSALLVRVSTVYYPLLKSPPVAVPLSCFRRHSVGSNAHCHDHCRPSTRSTS
jgi:hypothetical protein